MLLTFDKKPFFCVPEKILTILNNELAKLTEPDLASSGVTFNFTDDDYSAEDGGFHPVEVRVSNCDHQWGFDYITSFCFEGSPYPELIKAIDVCFQSEKVQSIYSYCSNVQESNEHIELFLNNFISYVEMDAFTVSVSFD
ncbi:MAG: hypothetical protein ACI936_002039 [Paraglaciecola sp.]|jgi:hypothetical protein